MNPAVGGFVTMSLLGGFCFVLMDVKGWEDLKSFRSIRHLVISAIVGILYFNLYSAWDWPNSIMSFVCGWMGPSFIEHLIKRLSKEQAVSPVRTTE